MNSSRTCNGVFPLHAARPALIAAAVPGSDPASAFGTGNVRASCSLIGAEGSIGGVPLCTVEDPEPAVWPESESSPHAVNRTVAMMLKTSATQVVLMETFKPAPSP
jgi:hypothetical protein